MAMTIPPAEQLLAQMSAEREELRRQGVVQFDGSAAWTEFTASLTGPESAPAKGEAIADLGAEELPGHFGTELP